MTVKRDLVSFISSKKTLCTTSDRWFNVLYYVLTLEYQLRNSVLCQIQFWSFKCLQPEDSSFMNIAQSRRERKLNPLIVHGQALMHEKISAEKSLGPCPGQEQRVGKPKMVRG